MKGKVLRSPEKRRGVLNFYPPWKTGGVALFIVFVNVNVSFGPQFSPQSSRQSSSIGNLASKLSVPSPGLSSALNFGLTGALL